MSIIFDEKENIFLIHTENTSYAMALVDGTNLHHVYYGKRIHSTNLRYVLCEDVYPFIPSTAKRETNGYIESSAFEYPQTGMGDYRDSAFCVKSMDGHRASELVYRGYEIKAGKPALPGLPATWGDEKESSTLCIYLEDALLGLKVTLNYSIFEGIDAIIRSATVENHGSEAVYLEKVLSSCIEMRNRNFEMLTLPGSWARERHIQKMPIGYGRQNAGSFRGKSSPQEHPFMALVTPGTNQTQGEVYAMNFVYSGNFIAQVERNEFDFVRMTMGIHPEGFCWKLQPGESFVAPEVVNVYSANGLEPMTHTFHHLYRKHLIRSPYLHKERPILINNWEATYFDFDEKKLIDIAKEASALGIEMLVMDDGWFGKRDTDDCSLGDWQVNEEKLKGGLPYLVEEVKKTGMKFGIWFEPEMICPDSDLFRAHPDWAIQIPGREIIQSRAQYVLDLTRQEVVDAVYDMIDQVLKSADISYVKWDMNRFLTNLGSAALPADRQGEICHRFMLGVYQLQERLITDYPDLLLENCSSGGGRFDPGMLYYSPQIWCSDDTDAIERLAIQEGTALIYPLSTMGAHVSVCPNHAIGRTTPFETRGTVALAGTFGYELDITKLSDEDKALVKEQTKQYHKYHHLVAEGEYYRLASYSENNTFDCFMVVSEDKSQALVFYVQVLFHAQVKSRLIPLRGLDSSKVYLVNGTEYSGDLLQNVGLRVDIELGDFTSKLIEIVEK